MNVQYVAARYLASFLILIYGFAKLNGSQFTILDSELDKPMGAVSGFWLTWYYFGYSPIYGTLIALVQIFGGVLLMFRKTTLLGACILFPVITNIILVDVFYAIDLGALLVAIIIECALIIILAGYKRELVELFWSKQNVALPAVPKARWKTHGKNILRIMMLVIPAAFTYWVANYNNRFPTPLDGAWDVIETSPNLATANDIPSSIFFERNRAALCVFKLKTGSYEWHHFEVNPADRTIAVWQLWLQKGDKIFDGRYEKQDFNLRLKGKFVNHSDDSLLVLRKRV